MAITVQERDFSNHYAMFGTDATLVRLGSRKWGVMNHPGVFATRRDAREAASRLFLAIGRKKNEG